MPERYVRSKSEPSADLERCPHGRPACRQCRPHPWRQWGDYAWKLEPFPGACGDCGKAEAEHNDGRDDG